MRVWEENENMLIPYYLMLSYLYYEQNVSLIDDAEFDVAFVNAFIIIKPGIIKIVYGIPSIDEILFSRVNPNITIYNIDEVRPGIIVWR